MWASLWESWQERCKLANKLRTQHWTNNTAVFRKYADLCRLRLLAHRVEQDVPNLEPQRGISPTFSIK